MIRISLLTGELVFTALWLLCRAAVWVRQRRIDWKREAELLLMYINLAVLIRFVFYPFFKVNGQVQPLVIDPDKLFPPRINCIPFRNIIDYEIRREAVINIIGNICLFIPTAVPLPPPEAVRQNRRSPRHPPADPIQAAGQLPEGAFCWCRSVACHRDHPAAASEQRDRY